jgi:hypothetical protein
MSGAIEWLLAIESWVVIAAAIVIGLGVLYSRVLRPLLKAVRSVISWGQRVEAHMEYVAKEMAFNGGSSARDSIMRMEKRLIRLEQAAGILSEFEARVDEHTLNIVEERHRAGQGVDE